MPEIFIQIAPEIDREIPPEIPRDIFKPILTQEQEIELVEKCLRFFKFNSKLNENRNFDLWSFFLHLRGSYPKRSLSPFSRVMEFLHKYFISICSLNLILN